MNKDALRRLLAELIRSVRHLRNSLRFKGRLDRILSTEMERRHVDLGYREFLLTGATRFVLRLERRKNTLVLLR